MNLDRDPDFTYTQAEAILDGIFQRFAPDVLVTTALYAQASPEALRSVVELYRRGVYADPPEADPHREASAWMAYYIRDGMKIWAHGGDGGMLTLMRPEDY